MSVETPKPQLEIDSSLMNLFDKSMLQSAFWTADTFADVTHQAGYTGMEWHPVRGIRAGIQVNHGRISSDVNDSIRSLHQSWRSEKNLKEVWQHPNRPLAAISYVLLPERVSSLQDLSRLQTKLGKKLPIVLYPDEKNSGADMHFAEKLFQPLPEVMRDWGVKTPGDLIAEAGLRRYTGSCLDLFHMREAAESGDLNPWEKTLPQLLSYTKEIHVAAGRTDIKQEHIDTMQELEDIKTGRGDSDMLKMLSLIRESNWTGRVVTEIPAASLHALRSKNHQPISVKYLIEDHKRIVGNLQAMLG